MLNMAALSNEAPPSEPKSQSLIGKVNVSLHLPLEVPVAIETVRVLTETRAMLHNILLWFLG